MNPFQSALKIKDESIVQDKEQYVILIQGNGNKVLVESKTNTGQPEIFNYEELRTAEAFVKKVIRPALSTNYRIDVVNYKNYLNMPLVVDVSKL